MRTPLTDLFTAATLDANACPNPVRVCVMKGYAIVAGVFLLMPPVMAEAEVPDVQEVRSLLERNSIAGKVLDVTETSSVIYKQRLSKQDSHLVFDAKTRKYREERKMYDADDPANPEYSLDVSMWNGEEYVKWDRTVSKEPGYRNLGQGAYEDPGRAVIEAHGRDRPAFVEFYYHHRYYEARIFTEVIPKENPKITREGNTITIASEWNKFEFSKETGALERLVSYAKYQGDKEKRVVETWDFSGHVERSGSWIPLKIVRVFPVMDDGVKIEIKIETVVDPGTLRLLDAVEDDFIFNKALPAGCHVLDEISQRRYTATTLASLFMEALNPALEKLKARRQKPQKLKDPF
jgi:hypothetical protein